jgi:hypothetical protein
MDWALENSETNTLKIDKKPYGVLLRNCQGANW